MLLSALCAFRLHVLLPLSRRLFDASHEWVGDDYYDEARRLPGVLPGYAYLAHQAVYAAAQAILHRYVDCEALGWGGSAWRSHRLMARVGDRWFVNDDIPF